MSICIKPDCGKPYEGDPDDYCAACRESNKALAEQIDKQMSARPHKEIKSTIAQLEEHGEVPIAPGMKAFSRKINYGN